MRPPKIFMASEKKTLFVDGRWLAQPGQGVYTYFHEIYSRIVQRDRPDLEVIFGLLPGHKPEFLPRNAKVLEYKNDSFLWRQLGLGRAINRLMPDFVHFQYVLPWGLNPRIHTMVALHDVIFLDHPEFFSRSYRLARKFFFGASARKADSLLTISDKSARDIHKHFEIPRQRIEVIPLGAGSRLRHIEPLEVPSLAGCRFLLTVGRHEPRKNYPRLIEAFVNSRLFETQGTQLVIAGWIAEEFRQSVAAAPAGVVMLTDCSDQQLAWLFTHAQGFVFPSIAEGYGLPLVEALEFNLPSATSATYPIDAVRDTCVA
ncbi:MAG: hypothetical protein RLZZ598_890, partial [Pseudomonadota bacterium]